MTRNSAFVFTAIVATLPVDACDTLHHAVRKYNHLNVLALWRGKSVFVTTENAIQKAGYKRLSRQALIGLLRFEIGERVHDCACVVRRSRVCEQTTVKV